MNRLLKIAALVSAVLLSCSCIKEQLELVYSQQEAKIDTYITSLIDKNETYTVTHNQGSNRVTMVQGTGDAAGKDAEVTFRYAAYIFTGSISANSLLDTNHAETAEKSGWNVTDNDFNPLTIDLGNKDFIKGLRYGLQGVQKGEECQIIFSGKYGFGNKHSNIVGKNQPLLYHIWVEGVTNK